MNFFPHISQEEQKKEWFCLWQPIINKLKSNADHTESNFINCLNTKNGTALFPYNWYSIKHLTEFALSNAENIKDIFSNISTKIKPNQENDNNEIIQQMLTEIKVIPALVLFGFKDIVYCRKDGVDFEAKLNGTSYGIEATYICGPNFKTQEKYLENSAYKQLSPVYLFKQKKLINRLKSIYDNKEKQVTKYEYNPSNAIICIMTNLEETDPFWLEHDQHNGKHPIQSFIDSRNIPTILMGAGLNLYISTKLNTLLSPFDREQYVTLAYGIDSKTGA